MSRFEDGAREEGERARARLARTSPDPSDAAVTEPPPDIIEETTCASCFGLVSEVYAETGECRDCFGSALPSTPVRPDLTDEEVSDEEWAVSNGIRLLRLTGEQVGSIEPSLDSDWFTDFDEYELFVPVRLLRAALRAEQVERPNLHTALAAALHDAECEATIHGPTLSGIPYRKGQPRVDTCAARASFYSRAAGLVAALSDQASERRTG